MPIQSCTKDGKPGYRWGESGVCYTYNPQNSISKGLARAKALKQARAIEASQAREKKSE